MSQPKQKALMDLRSAARYLGVCEDKLRTYARKKIVPAFKIGESEGCSWHFSKVALDRWMEEMIERQQAGGGQRKKQA